MLLWFKHLTLLKQTIYIVVVAFVVFFGSWYFAYILGFNDLPIQSEDTLPAMFLPYAILQDKTLYLDKHYNVLITKYPHPDDKKYTRGLTPFYLTKVEATDLAEGSSVFHYLSAFTLITPLLTLPVYFLPVLFSVPPTWENLILISHAAAALLVAISGGILFALCSKYLKTTLYESLLVTFVYLFATVNYAMLSQALWQHGTVELLSLAGLYLTYYATEKKGRSVSTALASLLLGFMVLARPTAILIAVYCALIYVYRLFLLEPKSLVPLVIESAFFPYLKKNIKYLLIYLIFHLVPFLFFYWYSNVFYLGVKNQGYAEQFFVSWLGRFPEGFIGMWISPSKGILIYSPVLIFSIIGLYLQIKKAGLKNSLEYLVFGSIVFTHTLILSRWKHWYGGYSFGYRMASDVIPFIVLCMVPFIQSPSFSRYKRVFYVLLTISVMFQIMGILFFDGVWHAAYDGGFVDTSWLWSIKDSELMFNIRRILVKFGYLVQACPKCAPSNL
ncbi:MAG: hypothetical protein R3B92_03575 [Patescibacteria group bacterium]